MAAQKAKPAAAVPAAFQDLGYLSRVIDVAGETLRVQHGCVTTDKPEVIAALDVRADFKRKE